MLKIVTAGTTALMLIAGVSAYAQQPNAARTLGDASSSRQKIAPHFSMRASPRFTPVCD